MISHPVKARLGRRRYLFRFNNKREIEQKSELDRPELQFEDRTGLSSIVALDPRLPFRKDLYGMMAPRYLLC